MINAGVIGALVSMLKDPMRTSSKRRRARQILRSEGLFRENQAGASEKCVRRRRAKNKLARASRRINRARA